MKQKEIRIADLIQALKTVARIVRALAPIMIVLYNTGILKAFWNG
jgi:hypothetical protein